MQKTLMFCSALVVALGCTRGENDSTATETVNELPAAALLWQGDAGADGGVCRGRYYPTLKDRRTPHTPRSDVELIDTLVPHHQMAIEMAKLEIAQGADVEVKAMAETMAHDQAEEIETLLHIRDELTGCTTVTRFPDPHMEREMQRMMQLSGIALDLAFLDNMIPHHGSAVQFTHYALPNLRQPELETLAHEVIDAQAKEIGDMHAKKKELARADP